MSEDTKGEKDQDQLSMRLYVDDTTRLTTIQDATGLGLRTEAVRYALKYTADRLPEVVPPETQIRPQVLHYIMGLTGLLGAFLAVATEGQDGRLLNLRSYRANVLHNIGDPVEICSLLAEQIGDRPIWLHYSPSTHFHYELTLEVLQPILLQLATREASDEEGQPRPERPSYRLYLDDLLAVYADVLRNNQDPKAYAAFVMRLRRQVSTALLSVKGREP